ncbi:type III secretion system translocator chaperone SicA [Iodobacter sp. LRB]|uniref:type III secretion system translocator chaperone SicA n=1 Tax=unclassified Iodobacter TaxID=235634 RepID=UPI000C10D921|nr:type III secretion system translocator chaperone SicA [Iodobacter sp. BJB302]PHU99934.1 CesD/SycD/LcrH family type III secretion system chaperone [Iodobacter sp. BJB302]
MSRMNENLMDEGAAEVLWEAVLNGAALKDIQGIPSNVMEGIYAYAFEFYQQGRLDEAETFFRFLCLYDMYDPDYAMGLAAIFQMRKEYLKAAGAYSLAFALGKNDYRPMFYAGQCNLHLKKVSKAKQCFETVLLHGAKGPLTERAQAYLEAMQNVQSATEAEPETEAESENEMKEFFNYERNTDSAKSL